MDDRLNAVLRVLSRAGVALAVAAIASGKSAIWILAGAVLITAIGGWAVAFRTHRNVARSVSNPGAQDPSVPATDPASGA